MLLFLKTKLMITSYSFVLIFLENKLIYAKKEKKKREIPIFILKRRLSFFIFKVNNTPLLYDGLLIYIIST